MSPLKMDAENEHSGKAILVEVMFTEEGLYTVTVMFQSEYWVDEL